MLAGLAPFGPLPATTVHLDRGYGRGMMRRLLDELGFTGEVARQSLPAPVHAGSRWVAERTQGWMNGFGKLRLSRVAIWRAGPSHRRVVSARSSC